MELRVNTYPFCNSTTFQRTSSQSVAVIKENDCSHVCRLWSTTSVAVWVANLIYFLPDHDKYE